MKQNTPEKRNTSKRIWMIMVIACQHNTISISFYLSLISCSFSHTHTHTQICQFEIEFYKSPVNKYLTGDKFY